MFYSAFGYAQLAALISASCTPIVAAAAAARRGGGGGRDAAMDVEGCGGERRYQKARPRSRTQTFFTVDSK